MSYDMSQVTSTFDTLASKVLSELDSQYSKGRIKGTDYANVYSNLMNTILQLSIDIPIKDKQVEEYNKQMEVQDAQIKEYDKQIELQDAQISEIQANKELKERQIKGFDDKIRTDLFKIQMDTWGMMFSSGMLDKKPDIITNDETSRLYTDIKSRL